MATAVTQPKIVMYGAEWCGDCKMAKDFFAKHKIIYELHDIDTEKGALDAMLVLTNGSKSIPAIQIGDTLVQEPSYEQLEQLLGIKQEKEDSVQEVLMIGAGPSALTAAVYTTREDIDTVLIEKGVIGGLAATTDWVDNYPGFPEGISGLDLAENLRKQAERFGAKIELDEVTNIKKDGDVVVVETYGGERRAKAVLVATGTEYKKIGVPGEAEYLSRGVHYCATCDGAFYREKNIVVVGGGNSAVQEALFLTKFAKHIDLLVRGDSFRASDVLLHELEKNKQITVHMNTTTDEIIGDGKTVIAVKGTDKVANKEVTFDVDGVFVFVGLKPNTHFLGKDIELDEFGFVKTNDKLETSLTGVFAAGDVRSGATMQIASAVGEGATAALRIREYLEALSKK
jgi:thioredoxin reductase (NADPH)